MRNYKIDETLLPQVYVTWNTTKGGHFKERFWLNCKTGKKKNTPESWMYYPNEERFKYSYGCGDNEVRFGLGWYTRDYDKIWVNSGTKLIYGYAKYHADIDKLEIAAVTIDTSRKEEARHWTYAGERYFIDRDKHIYKSDGQRACGYYKLYEYHSAYSGKQLIGLWTRLNSNHNAITDQFIKFIGKNYFVIGTGKCVQIHDVYSINRWYETTQKGRTKGKKQVELDKLTAVKLSDLSHLVDKEYYLDIESYVRGQRANKILANVLAYFERVNDEADVIRLCYRKDKSLCENYRIYICTNGKTHMTSLSDEGWIPTTKQSDRYDEYSYFVNKDEATQSNKYIQYNIEALNTMDERSNYVRDLITMLKSPEIEQFIKLGCEPVARTLLNSSSHNADLKDWFGDCYNDRAKNILNKIYLTKPQLDIYMNRTKADDYYTSHKRGLKIMRSVFGNDLRALDSGSFERYLAGFTELQGQRYMNVETLIRQSVPADFNKFIKNIVRIGEKQQAAYRLVGDIIDTIRYNFGPVPEIDWYFDDYSDIVRVHDVLVELKRQRDMERRAL